MHQHLPHTSLCRLTALEEYVSNDVMVVLVQGTYSL